ncbi:MAG TPA: methyltransferase [Nitrospiraceae bacterium]|nr:methyltransferase [Nitrospiraceae bacterium]
MSRDLSLAEVFQLGYYWETKILLTAVKLDVFSALDQGIKTAEEVAGKIGADAKALSLLLNALVALRLLRQDQNGYANSAVARDHLVKHSSQYIGHLLLLHDAEWNNWGRLEEAVRTGQSPAKQHVFETDPSLGANVLTVLHRIGRQSGPELAKRLALDQARTMLDLGGGAGTNAIAFCEVYPALKATVFELPATLALTQRTVKETGMEDRIRLVPGNFNTDDLGGSYDVILMSDVLHYQNYEANARVVRKTFSHLAPGGRLVVKDRYLDASGTSPAWTTAFAVHIFINTEQGACYRIADAMEWMQAAGFERIVELERTAVVEGVKPVGA